MGVLHGIHRLMTGYVITSPQKVDPKGRVMIPKGLREEENSFLTRLLLPDIEINKWGIFVGSNDKKRAVIPPFSPPLTEEEMRDAYTAYGIPAKYRETMSEVPPEVRKAALIDIGRVVSSVDMMGEIMYQTVVRVWYGDRENVIVVACLENELEYSINRARDFEPGPRNYAPSRIVEELAQNPYRSSIDRNHRFILATEVVQDVKDTNNEITIRSNGRRILIASAKKWEEVGTKRLEELLYRTGVLEVHSTRRVG
jgi:DNA-binding transcriptional regulator/RsmH inhibitor MraZ